MKYGFFGLAIIMTGLLGILFIGLFQSITVNNETEYYVIKEAMEASMLEAVDIACYRDADETKGCGERIKISEQKFVENFTRRFAENISGDVNSFELDFYDIIESPPKASVVIKGLTKEYGIMVTETSDGSFNITNRLSGILEYDPLINSGSGGSLSAGSNPDSDLEFVELKVKEEFSENSTGGAGGGTSEECSDCGGDYDANDKNVKDGHVSTNADGEEEASDDEEVITDIEDSGGNGWGWEFPWN